MAILCAIPPYVVAIIISVVAVQYALALFCLLKLAYLDIEKRTYVLWNIFILLVFFVGDITFLIYYYKVGKNKRIPAYVPPVESDDEKGEPESENDDARSAEPEEKAEDAEQAGDREQSTDTDKEQQPERSEDE